MPLGKLGHWIVGHQDGDYMEACIGVVVFKDAVVGALLAVHPVASAAVLLVVAVNHLAAGLVHVAAAALSFVAPVDQALLALNLGREGQAVLNVVVGGHYRHDLHYAVAKGSAQVVSGLGARAVAVDMEGVVGAGHDAEPVDVEGVDVGHAGGEVSEAVGVNQQVGRSLVGVACDAVDRECLVLADVEEDSHAVLADVVDGSHVGAGDRHGERGVLLDFWECVSYSGSCEVAAMKRIAAATGPVVL